MDEVFGLSMTKGVLIGAVVIVAYCLLGGFWAASVTDALQERHRRAASGRHAPRLPACPDCHCYGGRGYRQRCRHNPRDATS